MIKTKSWFFTFKNLDILYSMYFILKPAFNISLPCTIPESFSLVPSPLSLSLKWQNFDLCCMENYVSSEIFGTSTWILFLNVLWSFNRSLIDIFKIIPWNILCHLPLLVDRKKLQSTLLCQDKTQCVDFYFSFISSVGQKPHRKWKNVSDIHGSQNKDFKELQKVMLIK